MTLKSSRTYKYDLSIIGEKNTKPSETIPNDAYTIGQLLQKFTTGIMPPVNREGLYSDDDLDDMDPTDYYDFDRVDAINLSIELSENKQRLDEAKDKFNKEEQKRKEQAENNKKEGKEKQERIDNNSVEDKEL